MKFFFPSHGENEGKKTLYTIKYKYFVFIRIEQNVQLAVMKILVFGHHLAAGATRGSTRQCSIRPAGHNGKSIESIARMLCRGSKHSGALGTEATRIGNILLVSANDHLARRQPQGGTDTETGIGCIGLPGGLDGRLQQLGIGAIELVASQLLIVDGEGLLHKRLF